MPRKPKSTKPAAVAHAERKLWKKERRELGSKKRLTLKEASVECTRLQRALNRLRNSTSTRLREIEKREAILNQRLGS